MGHAVTQMWEIEMAKDKERNAGGEEKKKGKSMKDRKRKRRVVNPAPIYDIVGWVTEHEAAELKSKIDPPDHGSQVNRTTISRWRSNHFVHSIDINGALILVNLREIKDFEGVPLGNPALVYDLPGYPQKVDPLPEEITITLRRRKFNDEEPNKIRSQWD